MMHDVAVIGGGMAGMATAARLQRRGLSTVVLEAHGQPGGCAANDHITPACAGFFRRKGFSFDVGATTLVDFAGDGVGAELLRDIEMPLPDLETLPGYVAWLPDRTVTLHRDHNGATKGDKSNTQLIGLIPFRRPKKYRMQVIGDEPREGARELTGHSRARIRSRVHLDGVEPRSQRMESLNENAGPDLLVR